eukprot:CAMPEP_0194226880 /NCGR_PEP_ID=MMETSP0156-20130528/42573_1 /TAXON_ID=33649 /ORGANISM="Thalassionema nitzschioides, Strain L26-B" /LENGTH=614 /DNA_ID=CAMNT_0038959347 /DNA_START=256 /DNA_END=2100 /DNA_ORIENTATION=-
MATNGVNHAMNADGTPKFAPAPNQGGAYIHPAQADAYTPTPVNAVPPPAPTNDAFTPNPVQPNEFVQPNAPVPAPVAYAPAPAHGAPTDAYAPINVGAQPQMIAQPAPAQPGQVPPQPGVGQPVPPQHGVQPGVGQPVPAQHGQPGQVPPPHGQPGQVPPPHGQPGQVPPQHGQPGQVPPQPGAQPLPPGSYPAPTPNPQYPNVPAPAPMMYSPPPGTAVPPHVNYNTPSDKKPRLSNSSNVLPMGELRPTDILAGNYRKRPGNSLYKTLLRQYAPEVGKTEMKIIVAKVYEAIARQNPPGRFIREGGDALMSRAQTNQKIARALREVADRASAKMMEQGGGAANLPFAAMGDRRLSKALTSPKGEPVGEIRPSDVLTGNYRKRPGNALYKKLLRENAHFLDKQDNKVLVSRVIEGISNQNPPGRFIREGGTSLLTTGQVRQKVSRALKEVVDRSDRPEGEPTPKKARKSLSAKSEEPIGEIRDTDVLTGNYRKRRGNALYKALLRQNAPRVNAEEMKNVVKTVIDGIYQQHPPGRFIREGGGSLLSRGQVHQKVARALREVVDRTSGTITPNKAGAAKIVPPVKGEQNTAATGVKAEGQPTDPVVKPMETTAV